MLCTCKNIIFSVTSWLGGHSLFSRKNCKMHLKWWISQCYLGFRFTVDSRWVEMPNEVYSGPKRGPFVFGNASHKNRVIFTCLYTGTRMEFDILLLRKPILRHFFPHLTEWGLHYMCSFFSVYIYIYTYTNIYRYVYFLRLALAQKQKWTFGQVVDSKLHSTSCTLHRRCRPMSSAVCCTVGFGKLVWKEKCGLPKYTLKERLYISTGCTWSAIRNSEKRRHESWVQPHKIKMDTFCAFFFNARIHGLQKGEWVPGGHDDGSRLLKTSGRMEVSLSLFGP